MPRIPSTPDPSRVPPVHKPAKPRPHTPQDPPKTPEKPLHVPAPAPDETPGPYPDPRKAPKKIADSTRERMRQLGS
jgi:hypothetical protein